MCACVYVYIIFCTYIIKPLLSEYRLKLGYPNGIAKRMNIAHVHLRKHM